MEKRSVTKFPAQNRTAEISQKIWPSNAVRIVLVRIKMKIQ